MRRRTAWRVRNNPLEIDLFERSSQTTEAIETDTTETDSTFDPMEPVEMARNDKGNARKRLSDYAKPVLQRPVEREEAHLGHLGRDIVELVEFAHLAELVHISIRILRW